MELYVPFKTFTRLWPRGMIFCRILETPSGSAHGVRTRSHLFPSCSRGWRLLGSWCHSLAWTAKEMFNVAVQDSLCFSPRVLRKNPFLHVLLFSSHFRAPFWQHPHLLALQMDNMPLLPQERRVAESHVFPWYSSAKRSVAESTKILQRKAWGNATPRVSLGVPRGFTWVLCIETSHLPPPSSSFYWQMAETKRPCSPSSPKLFSVFHVPLFSSHFPMF